MHQHQSLGLVIKVHAVYSTPFWREDGLSGTGFGAGSLVQEVYDNTNHGDSRGTLVGFISDEKADAVFELGAEDRRRAILGSIAGFAPEPSRTSSMVRRRPMASYWSNARPSGSIFRWHPAQLASLRWASIFARTDALGWPGGVGLMVPALGGGGGGGLP